MPDDTVKVIRTTAGEAAAELSRRGIPPDQSVTITVDADDPERPARPKLADIAARMRATAAAQGLTTEIFDALLARR